MVLESMWKVFNFDHPDPLENPPAAKIPSGVTSLYRLRIQPGEAEVQRGAASGRGSLPTSPKLASTHACRGLRRRLVGALLGFLVM
jgi:hypothetical protein